MLWTLGWTFSRILLSHNKKKECHLYFLKKMNEIECYLRDFLIPCKEEIIHRFLHLSVFFEEDNNLTVCGKYKLLDFSPKIPT